MGNVLRKGKVRMIGKVMEGEEDSGVAWWRAARLDEEPQHWVVQQLSEGYWVTVETFEDPADAEILLDELLAETEED